MRLSEFFERARSREIVINSDIDGFLSGMILQKYYGCEIVGFSNSKESIWLRPDIDSVRLPIYVDIFVNTPETYCIDQHIVAYDNDHLERLLAYQTKLNPNLDVSRRTYIGDLGESADYYHKYPFGTVHYLIALMKLDGIDVEVNNLEQEYNVTVENVGTYSVTPGQVILRADDALFSSFGKYQENTQIWWNNLNRSNSQTIKRLIAYMNGLDPQKNEEYKESIGQLFVQGLGCNGKDGAFDTITKPGSRDLQDRIIWYNDVINTIIGIKMELPSELVEHRGTAYRGAYNTNDLERAFTYAFVTSPKKPNDCFSYTVWVE